MISFYLRENPEGCGATALSIGWHLGIVKELAENRSWNEEMFTWFCEEVRNGALFNRAATEPNTGSHFTRGGKPETLAVKKGEKWIINGRKRLRQWRQYLIILSFQQVLKARKKSESLSFQRIR